MVIGFVGIVLYESNMGVGVFSIVPIALGMFIQVFLRGFITLKLVAHLKELYDRKGNFQEMENIFYGGRK